jgi:Na+-driven multidrug efflux pump
MLGRLTQDSVAAMSLANQIVFIMNLFIGAVVGGGGALVAQYFGKNDRTMVKNLFCMMM